MKAQWSDFFDFDATMNLLSYDFVQQALVATALLGILGGVLGPMVVSRQMSFAVHGTSELSFTGAAAALLFGFSVNLGGVIGAIVAAVIFGLLGNRVRERDSVIGVVMAFGLGLAVLFIALNPGRIGTGFNLLAGQAINAGTQGAEAVVITTVVVVAAMAVIYRPLLFASTDPRVAEARGVPMRLLSVVFAVLLGAAVAQSVQIIGALLVMSLLITPAAAAMRVSSNPTVVLGLSILFAEIAAVGGIVLSLAPGLPVSAFVTTISFVIYLVCRVVGSKRSAGSGRRRVPTSSKPLLGTSF
ncbi:MULTISPECIES: metal ABC transporter permease [Williamsia]|jgi:zinc/manganese transport system permease protein|uniref:Zinc/manganese transport system permease protein n=1 Tax=Williamsia marianensis TaxID=85044 RepID=A0A315TAN4_WILMA|nr:MULTISPECIES: metal ABC transporter permease [Williamsia]ETD31063.1 helicase [Williamsia sp. D3]PVY28893.1 zinc/manganese transport system permease protein [Williamsia marianensis]RKR94086.1 zinc/manganese transport system permease protein [Williamsia muralis]